MPFEASASLRRLRDLRSTAPTLSFTVDTDSKREYTKSIPGLIELSERIVGSLYQEVLARSAPAEAKIV